MLKKPAGFSVEGMVKEGDGQGRVVHPDGDIGGGGLCKKDKCSNARSFKNKVLRKWNAVWHDVLVDCIDDSLSLRSLILASPIGETDPASAWSSG